MSWPSRIVSLTLQCTLFVALLTPRTRAQWFVGSLLDTTNRADYLIVSPRQYVDAVQPLAQYRSSHTSLTVAVVLLDSIASQFPRGSLDSSIQAFAMHAFMHWQPPHPRYVLLAGNVNAVPSHVMVSTIGPEFGEDSVMVDQWFVSQLADSQASLSPLMALGRFPAWSKDELATMVSKTLLYDQAEIGPWASRSIAVADSGDGAAFEQDALVQQMEIAPRWKDTVTIHVDSRSPSHKSREEFLALWNQGCGIMNFVGHANGPHFSRELYFTSNDVKLLSANSSLTFCLFGGKQRFDRSDTVSLSVALMQGVNCGATCVIAPSGLMFESGNIDFAEFLFGQLTTRPEISIGTAWLSAEQQMHVSFERVRTLLGDPALVLRSSTVASVVGRPGTIPAEYALYQNYPNPFNPTTIIRYALPALSRVSLRVYNTLGQKVADLVDGDQPAGYHEVRFDGSRLASGVYFSRLDAGGIVLVKKMALLK